MPTIQEVPGYGMPDIGPAGDVCSAARHRLP